MSPDPGPRTDTRGHLPRAASVAALVLAVVCVALWIGAARTRQYVTHRRVNAAPISVAIDGCPATASCRPNGSVRPTVLALVRSEFGASALVNSAAVVDRASGRPYEETLSVRTVDGVDVAVSARCVAGAGDVASTRPAAIPTVGPADLSAVVAGAAGCSAGVAVHVGTGVLVAPAWTRALALAGAPGLQLPG